jgi:hypothetical protein
MAWRLERHRLDERAPKARALGVVGEICGLHAQLMSSAELSLWARVEKLKRSEVEKWLWTDRRLVKTWAMRGTLHLLKSDEYQLWQAGLSTYEHYLKPAWFKAFGVSKDDLDRLVASISKALDGRSPTRDELAERVAKIARVRGADRQVARELGSDAQARSVPGSTVLWPEQRTQRFLCAAGSVARAR